MKATGIVRQVDKLGRIVIPKEIRRKFDIVDDEDCFEIFVGTISLFLRSISPDVCSAENPRIRFLLKGI